MLTGCGGNPMEKGSGVRSYHTMMICQLDGVECHGAYLTNCTRNNGQRDQGCMHIWPLMVDTTYSLKGRANIRERNFKSYTTTTWQQAYRLFVGHVSAFTNCNYYYSIFLGRQLIQNSYRLYSKYYCRCIR